MLDIFPAVKRGPYQSGADEKLCIKKSRGETSGKNKPVSYRCVGVCGRSVCVCGGGLTHSRSVV